MVVGADCMACIFWVSSISIMLKSVVDIISLPLPNRLPESEEVPPRLLVNIICSRFCWNDAEKSPDKPVTFLATPVVEVVIVLLKIELSESIIDAIVKLNGRIRQ